MNRLRIQTLRDRGVTLVELMVVLAIIGAMVGMASVAVRKNSAGRGAYSFANQVGARVADARLRAVASRRWQCLRVTTTMITHMESTVTGLAAVAPAAVPTPPANWQEVTLLPPINDVSIFSADNSVHDQAGEAPVPTAGANLPMDLCISPDGSLQVPGAVVSPVTIFFQDESNRQARILVVGATGNEYVLQGW